MATAVPDDRRWLRGRGRWRLFAGIWLVYLLPEFGRAWQQGGAERWLRLLLLVAFCYTYLDLVARGLTDQFRWLRWSAPALLAALAAALAGAAGPEALGALVYVVVAAVVLLPVRVAVGVTVAAVLATGLLPELVPGWQIGHEWVLAGQVLLAALAAFGFMALLRRTEELRAAQREVSQLAAERERLRIARDLHDLLGHSLTAVTVKARLAGRLVGLDDARAAEEIRAVERLARQSLADVRAAVVGYREVSLAVELATAREVLGAAGIAADLPRAVDEVPAELRELFGWAVREGITNAVRHSGASQVRVRVDPYAIEIVDDGRAAAGGQGSGLTGLAERAARLGGRVDAGPVAGGGYRLRVEVPPSTPVAASPPAGAPIRSASRPGAGAG